MKRINKTEEYMLYYDQFLALQEQGRLKEGSIYHILDLPDGLDLVEGKWTVKKAEQDAEGNIIHETYVKRLDLDYQVVDSLPTDKTAGKMIYLKNDGFNLSNLKISNGNEYTSFIPTKTSDLENDIHFATEGYVEQNGGKIDKILLNNEEQAIVGKAVNLTINKTTVGLSNVDNTSDLNKPISTQTQTALDGLNQTITNNFNTLNSIIENETERATLAETEISTKLQQEMNTRVQEHAEIQGKIDTINSKIPNQASSTNQLADKAFVNSTINSSAAFFKGSFKSKAALDAVQWQTTDSSLENYVTNNDYAYIESDETHNNEAWRYIYVKDNTVSEWQPQFRVNESPFTQAQLDAINSGATTDLINSIGSKLTQDAIVDSTGDSSIKAISQRAATLGINTAQSNLNTHILDKDNPHQVTKAQIGLGNVDNTSDLDKPISNAVRAALNDYLLIANVDSSLNSTSVNPVQNKVLYDPVTFAESERQKSKNLFDLNYNGTFNSKTETSVSKYIALKSVYGEKFTINTNLPQYSFSRGSVGDIYTNIIFKNLKPNTSYTISFTPISVDNDVAVHFLGVYNVQDKLNTKVTKTITTDENGQFNTGYGIWINGQNTTFVVKDIQLEEGSVATDYQPYNGAITHNNDAPVVFAEHEKNRAINLFNYKTQTVTSEVTNNQDGSFTISNLTFYYPSLRLNIALKPNTKYTFAETVLEVSDSVGLEASNVAFGVVAYYTDGTYSSTPEIPIRGTGRYSGTFTTNSKTIDYVEYRILRKNNDTSILNGKITDISVCEGDNTVYYPYEGLIVHEEQLSNYLPLSGGTMTGQLKLASDGLITNANDGYSTDAWGNLNALSSDAGALFKINSYDKSKSLTYAWNTGVLNLPAKPLINNQDVLALKSDIISSDGFVTIDTAQTITGKKTFNNSISIGSCTQTYNASTKSLVYSFE